METETYSTTGEFTMRNDRVIVPLTVRQAGGIICSLATLAKDEPNIRRLLEVLEPRLTAEIERIVNSKAWKNKYTRRQHDLA